MSNSDIKIINYEDKYLNDIYHLVIDTITNINSKDYTEEEIKAWINNIDINKLKIKFNESLTYLASYNDEIIGVINIYNDGYLDFLYVKKEYINKGVGSKLLNYVISLNKFKEIYLYASITSFIFFLNKRFTLIKKNVVYRDNVSLTNYFMKKLVK